MSETIDIVKLDLSEDIVASDGPMSALQQALVGRLQSAPDYAGVALIHENSLELLNEIDRALGQLGLIVVILTPDWTDESPNIPYPILDRVEVVAAVTENPLMNRSEGGLRIPGGVIAWRCARDLACTRVNGAMLIHKSGEQVVNPEDGTVVWNVRFETSLNT